MRKYEDFRVNTKLRKISGVDVEKTLNYIICIVFLTTANLPPNETVLGVRYLLFLFLFAWYERLLHYFFTTKTHNDIIFVGISLSDLTKSN